MVRKKKLLITTDCFLPRWDGVTRFLVEIIPSLLRQYQITLLAPEFEGMLNEHQHPWLKRITLVRFPLFPVQLGDIYFSNTRYSDIESHVKKADFIFNQTLGPIGFLSISAAKKHHKKLVSYVHSLEWELATKSVKRFKIFVHLLSRFFVRRLYNQCTSLLVPTHEVLEKLTFLGVRTEKHVLSLGTDTLHYFPTSDKAAAKKNLGFSSDDFVVGFVGRLGREKDLETLWKAFRRLDKKYPNVRLLLVGVGIREVERIFAGKRHVTLAGKQDHVVPYLQAMDVYVLPSLTETTSLSTLEAMSCAVPVVCTPAGYVKEYVHERVNGMLFPFHHSLMLFLKLEMLYLDPALRRKLGAAARKTIQQRFEIKKSIIQLQHMLKRFV